MKPAITKQQFIEKIGEKRCRSLEQRFNIDLNSDITIEAIYELLEKEKNELLERLERYEEKTSSNGGKQ